MYKVRRHSRVGLVTAALCLLSCFCNLVGGGRAEAQPPVHQHNDKSLPSQNVRRSWKGKIIVPEPNTVYENSSELLREGKKFYVHVAGGLIAYEMAIGAYLSPDSLFDIRYLKQYDMIAGQSQMISGSYTRFVHNSLYLRGAFVHRIGSVVDYLDSFAGNRGQRRSTDMGIDLGIGNRWQWDRISIGGEWFAITVPLIGKDYDDFDFQFRVMMIHLGVSL